AFIESVRARGEYYVVLANQVERNLILAIDCLHRAYLSTQRNSTHRCDRDVVRELRLSFNGSGSGPLVPAEDTQRPQRVPSAGPTVAGLERKVDLAGMRVLQQPGAIRLLLGSEPIDRFAHPRVRHVTDRAKVFKGAQHVVVPADRKRELQPGWVDDFA